MSSKLVIRVQKRSATQWAIWLLIVMPFMFGVLFEILPMPRALRYITDLAWMWLLLNYLQFSRLRIGNHIITILKIWIFLFLIYTFVTYWFNFQSPLYYLWGVRNNFRFYAAFLGFTIYLTEKDVEQYMKLFDVFFWINIPITIIQYFIFGCYADSLGGIFGTAYGVNAYTCMFFVIYTSKTILNYIHKAEKLWSMIVKLGAMMLISAVAEIKFYYFLLIMIMTMAIVMTKFSWRKILVAISVTAATLIGAALVANMYSGMEDFLSIEGILRIAASDKGYTSSGDINRLTAASMISDRFLTTWWDRLIGLGLGNCDGSGFQFLITPFYKQYNYLRYQWFSFAFGFLEMGYIGLVFFYGFFLIIIVALARKNRKDTQKTIYAQMASLVAVCCIAMSIYNTVLRMESGYMAYFVLAIPFMKEKRIRNTIAENRTNEERSVV